jgi:hypothetical protein
LFLKSRRDFPNVANAPDLKLRLGGFDVVLRNSTVSVDEYQYHGTPGIDLSRQTRSVTLDFNSMTLEPSE